MHMQIQSYNTLLNLTSVSSDSSQFCYASASAGYSLSRESLCTYSGSGKKWKKWGFLGTQISTNITGKYINLVSINSEKECAEYIGPNFSYRRWGARKLFDGVRLHGQQVVLQVPCLAMALIKYPLHRRHLVQLYSWLPLVKVIVAHGEPSRPHQII